MCALCSKPAPFSDNRHCTPAQPPAMRTLLPNCLQVQHLKRDELQAWCDARGIAPNEQLRTVQKQERLVKALNVEYRAEKQAQLSYLKAQKEAEELVSHRSVAKHVQATPAASVCCSHE